MRPGAFEGETESGRAYRITIEPVTGGGRATLTLYDVVAELRERTTDRAPVIRLETLKIEGPAS